MKAIDLLGGHKSVVAHFTYAGKEWSGIRVKSQIRDGEIKVLEASRIEGCVGDIKAESTLLKPDDSVMRVARKPLQVGGVK